MIKEELKSERGAGEGREQSAVDTAGLAANLCYEILKTFWYNTATVSEIVRSVKNTALGHSSTEPLSCNSPLLPT